MSEAADPDARDVGADATDDDVAPLVNPHLAPEYLRSMQDGLDAARARAERLEARIAKLEGDRAVLRERLEQARSAAAEARRRASIRGRLRALVSGGATAGASAGDGPARGASSDADRGRDADGASPEDDAVAELPVVGRIGPVRWPSPTPTTDVRIALVADEFTRTALSYEAPLLHLRASDGPERLLREGADVLLVESAYAGPDGTWRRRIARFGDPDPALVRLVEAARSAGVPTAFWNKEDPVNTDWFTASAALFDHVFTVDAGLIADYEQRLGHDRVHPLPFAAQPAIHRPPDRFEERTGPILFAGTWFARKHAERREQMSMLLDPAADRGLHILSRHVDDPRFAWPEHLAPHVVGSLPYPLAVEAARRYRVVVNVNTVTDSPTMCARRVFELAAAATPLVSGPSVAIESMVPSHAIRVVDTSEAAAAAYDELLGDSATAAAVGEAARAWVLDGHTWEHRLASVIGVLESRREAGDGATG